VVQVRRFRNVEVQSVSPQELDVSEIVSEIVSEFVSEFVSSKTQTFTPPTEYYLHQRQMGRSVNAILAIELQFFAFVFHSSHYAIERTFVAT
jgi:hypothetical protein